MRCPICHQEVKPEATEHPFCSQRCRVRDLANWADGVYRVPVKEGESDSRNENSSRRNP